MNQREVDGYEAVVRTLDDVIAQAPEALLVAGDIFDSPKPPNASVLFLFTQLQRVRAALPECHVVLIAGNHDTGRTIETASILPIYRAIPGVTVVTTRVERVVVGRDPDQFLVVTCVPSGAVKQPFAPDQNGRWNLLLMHAAVEYGDRAILGEQLEGWDYVALGDYHACHQVGARMWYPGSSEWTSTDPWSEAREHPEKGYLVVDLGPPEPVVEFRPIPTRRFVDLPVVDAAGLGPEDVGTALVAALSGDLEGHVVRQVVTNLSREVERALQWAPLREIKNRTFHLQLDFRRPEHQAVTPEGRAIRRKRLDEIVDEFLGARQLPSDVDRDALKKLGQEYLTIATEEGSHEVP